MLQIFNLDEDFHPKIVDGRLLKTSMHEHLYGVCKYEFQIKRGKLFISAMNGKLLEVTYDYRVYLPWSKRRNNKHLFERYARDGAWKQVINNELGKMFKSENDLYYVTWCSKTRTASFGTLFFYEQKNPIDF